MLLLPECCCSVEGFYVASAVGTAPLDKVGLVAIFRAIRANPVRPEEGRQRVQRVEGIVGVGEHASSMAEGADRFSDSAGRLSRLVRLPGDKYGMQGRCIGSR